MCLAIPLKIVEKKEKEAIAELNGIKRTIRTDLLKEVNIGDYVLVHAGFAIEKLKEEEALETLEAIREVEEALNGVNHG